MFNHLLGRGHREKFFESRHDLDIAKTTPSHVQSLADRWRENDKIDSSISTIYSDEMYPWPRYHPYITFAKIWPVFKYL